MPDNVNENEYMDEDEQQQIHFENLREIEEYARAAEGKIDGLYVETEMTQDADEARQLDVDRLDLKEEEDYINEKLEPGRYIDGREVAAIHQKYAKHIGQLQNELKDEKDPAKVAEIEKSLNKLKKSRNGELQRICDEAPKYNRSAIKAMMTQQLRNNDAGRVGGEIKIYRKEEGHEGLLVTTYGKNRVGEFNKMLRKHDERVAELKGRKAGEQARNLGHSTKEFLQGDAEHMFKGSVAMGLHAALFLLNKLSQAGNKSAQWALYLYARNKLTMGDMEALQKAVDEVSEESLGKNKEGDVAEQKGWNGTIESMDFGNQEFPPFDDMEKCETYDEEHDVLNVVASYIDDNGTMRQGSVYLGSEENIRQYLNSMGELDVEAEIAENAAKVEVLGIESLMVENVQEAYEEAAKNAEEAVEEAEEEEEEASETVLPPSEEDVFNIMDEDVPDNKEKGSDKSEPTTNGKTIPMDFKSKDLPPFKDMNVFYLERIGGIGKTFAMGVSFRDKNGNTQQENIILGTEDNIKTCLTKNFFPDMPKEDIPHVISENAEKVKALGLECLMVEDVQKAYDSLMGKGADKNVPESTSSVLPLSEEDVVTNIMGEKVEEESKAQEEADPDDLNAFLDANNDAKGLVDDAPVKSEADVSDILNELGDDDMSLG